MPVVTDRGVEWAIAVNSAHSRPAACTRCPVRIMSKQLKARCNRLRWLAMPGFVRRLYGRLLTDGASLNLPRAVTGVNLQKAKAPDRLFPGMERRPSWHRHQPMFSLFGRPRNCRAVYPRYVTRSIAPDSYPDYFINYPCFCKNAATFDRATWVVMLPQ
jgi:hypothetical protein